MTFAVLTGRRILVVEDDPPSRELMFALLTASGASVTLAANGQEAIEAFLLESFDCILMDVQMPVMNGLEATRRIRELAEASPERSRIVIVGVTAHAMVEHQRSCHEAGMDAVVTKPIDPQAMTQTISRLLDRLQNRSDADIRSD